MSSAFGFRDRIFRCLLASNQAAHFPLQLNGQIKGRMTELSLRHFASAESVNHVKHDQHKHRQFRRQSVIEALKGGTSLGSVKNPVTIIHECFTHVDNHLKSSNYSFHITPKDTMFSCELRIKWPSEQVFVGIAPNKKGAMREASMKALSALWKSRDITSSGLPMLVKNANAKLVSDEAKIVLTQDEQQALNELHNHYENVKSHIELAKTIKATDFGALEKEDETIDVIYNIPRSHPHLISHKKRYHRSLNLKERVHRPKIRAPLPIDDFKTELLEAVEKYKIILLRAETGSGKSSRYPQFIFDHYAALGKGVDCNIIVTQPRRLTAMSLARHVANERNEDLGDVVGYSVRLDNVLPRTPGGSILYCTAGKLLQSLMLNPNLEGVSHICLDEVHERPYDCDLIMGLLRRVLQRNPNLHITLMSATLDPEEFKSYFGIDCFVFDAPGRTYPVETYFLKDIPEELLQRNGEKTEYSMMARIIRWLDRKPPGGILMFLPGWKEIQGVNNMLQNDERFFVVLLHSNVPLGEQYKVHDSRPVGKRKVVLATNIAESSITIADIVYVVDFPYERIGRFSYEFNELEHSLVPCAKSRLIQRRGRAGRCQPGYCYHLLSEGEFEQLPESTVPVLLRMSLDYPILVSKALIGGESVQSFFADLLTPPERDHVENGIRSLQDLGALDSEENLTPLGRRLLCFGVEPRPAKAIVLSAVFRCQNIVSAYCSASEFFPFNIFSSFPNMLTSTDVHPNSDHMVMINLFHLWLELRTQHRAWQRLADSAGLSLSYGECAMAYKFMLNVLSRLNSSKMLLGASPDYLENGELQKEEFLKGVLLNVHKSLGLVKKSHFRGPIPVKKVRLCTLSGKLLIFSKESVFYKKTVDLSSPFVFHFPSVDTGAVVTSRCTSLLSPLSVLLFMPGPLEVATPRTMDESEKRIVRFNELVKIEMSKGDCESLLKLREAMTECVDYFVRKEGTSEKDTVGYSEIEKFRQHLTTVLGDILNAHAPGKSPTETQSQSQVLDLMLEEEK